MAKRSKSSARNRITTSSTAEYFSKNLQQVGFSSQTKAVLTTLKEAVDNALDACEDNGILPEIKVTIKKMGPGTLKNSDRIFIQVEDNGPGIHADDISKVFGEYLASSKFGRGRCSRGQQGIGISAATTWAQMTNATGAKVITKTSHQRKALSALVEVDIKHNKGVLKDKKSIDWDRPHGTSVSFTIDGRIQINGEAGLLSYLTGNVLVNPHLKLSYHLPDQDPVVVERVSDDIPVAPPATEPHPHTMKLGEFIAHSHLFGRVKVRAWLKKGFSRVSDAVMKDMVKETPLTNKLLDKLVDHVDDKEFQVLYSGLQNVKLKAPSTSSVLSVGEEGLARSIGRLGEVDFFSVVSRKPTICDSKPVLIETAIARFKERTGEQTDEPVQVLRFANRVPLQFDKASCAVVKAITTVNWRSYGIGQPKKSIPLGPYIVAVSVVSPFIKFKNASKETIDASDELVEEIRRALMQAGQRLSRHLKREQKAAVLESKIKHIEQFGPILVEALCRITGAPDKRKEAAELGLKKILGRDTHAAEKELKLATTKLATHLEDAKKRHGVIPEGSSGAAPDDGSEVTEFVDEAEEFVNGSPRKGKAKKKAVSKKVSKKTAKKGVKSGAANQSKKVNAPTSEKKTTKKKAAKKVAKKRSARSEARA